MNISTQQNPLYLSKLASQGRNLPNNTDVMLSPIPLLRRRLDSRESEDVFYTGDETPRCTLKYKVTEQTAEMSSRTSLSSKKKRSDAGIGIGRKFSQLFWKPKPKSSIGSDNSSNSGLASPTLTSNSSSPIYTNALLDSDSYSSSLSTSNSASDPSSSIAFYMNTAPEHQFYTSSYDDCQHYATNMYYNVGEGSHFSCRGLDEIRSRNNSVPTTSKSTKTILNSGADGSSPTNSYYNTNFSTFPNRRRHSLSASSTASSSKTDNDHVNSRDGYLVPILTKQLTFPKKKANRNLCLDEVDSAQVNVLADVHTPTSSEGADFGWSHNWNQTSNSSQSHEFKQQSSNDSSSTIVASSLPSHEKHCRDSRPSPLPSNRNHPSGTRSGCEPYCSLCASSAPSSTSTTPVSRKISTMDIAIVSCHECFFSQRVENQLEKLFSEIVGPNGQKLDTRLLSYDLKEIDEHTVAAEVHRSKIQIVIISNQFLDRVRIEVVEKKRISPLNRVLRSNRVVAVLISLSAMDITESHQNVLTRFGEWRPVEVRAINKLDTEFCRTFTDQVMKIFNADNCNISNFSVFPKRVTREQPKIAITFKKALDPGDAVRINMTRGRMTEQIENIVITNAFTIFSRVPDSLCADRTALIEISIFINNIRVGAKLIKCEYQTKQFEEDVIDRMIQALPNFQKMLDEHLAQRLSQDFRLNEDFSLDPELELMNDALICKGDGFPTAMHFAVYYGLQQTVWVLLEEGDGLEQCSVCNESGDTPFTIAQSRGYEKIGQAIKDFQEVTVSCRVFEYMKDLYERHSEETDLAKAQQLLTEDSSSQKADLLDLSNVELIGSTENEPLQDTIICTSTYSAFPDETSNGEPELAQILVIERTTVNNSTEGHVEPNSPEINTNHLFAAQSVPDYDIPPPPVLFFDNTPFGTSELIYYDTPRPTQEDYCIPPTDPKPVLPEKRIVNPVMTKKPNANTMSISDPDGYILVDAPHGEKRISTSDPEISMQSVLEDKEIHPSEPKASHSDSEVLKPSKSATNASDSKQIPLDPTEEELVELMNGFKKNEISMRELELLFANWKTRSDVQRDFKDWQKELKTTRDHYKKIQETIRRNNKNNSPLDRLLKYIPGSKRKHSKNLTVSTSLPQPQEEKSTELAPRSPEERASSQSEFDLDFDKEKFHGDGNIFWKNPLDRRFVTSYVSPTPNSSLIQSKSEEIITQDVIPSTPPPRPFKKPSLISDCPTVSPPISPFLNKKPPALPPALPAPTKPSSTTPIAKPTRKFFKGSKVFQPPAPPPPPRTINKTYL